MTYDNIEYELDDHVLRITCNRPQYRNAQSRCLLEDLDDAFARAAEDVDVHVIVLMGAGDHFSAGHDLAPRQKLPTGKSAPAKTAYADAFTTHENSL